MYYINNFAPRIYQKLIYLLRVSDFGHDMALAMAMDSFGFNSELYTLYIQSIN